MSEKARVLVVDDIEIWRDIIAEILEDNYDVDTAASLAEARRALAGPARYDAIITDIGLSADENNADGIQILRAAREMSPAIGAIAVSGRAANADREQFKQTHGALAYLDRDELEDVEAFRMWVAKAVMVSREARQRK